MKMIILGILGLGMMAGCSACSNNATHDYDRFLESFNQDLKDLGEPQLDFSKTIIVKKDLGNEKMGNCQKIEKNPTGIVVIELNNNLPKYISDNTLMALMYHEIGHCFYGLNHTDTGIMSIPYTNYSKQLKDKEQRLVLLKQLIQ